MSKRQIRLSDQTQIRNNIQSFLGKHINIVRRDNMVFYGVLNHIGAHEITLLNMRMKKVTFTFDAISELYLDVQA